MILLADTLFNETLRLNKDSADDFRSCQRFYSPTQDEEVHQQFINEAIEYGLQHAPELRLIRNLADANRLNGFTVTLRIRAENWLAVQRVIQDIKVIKKKLNEGDIIELCVRCYSEHLKRKKGLM